MGTQKNRLSETILFEYPQHRDCINNKIEIVGKRAEYPSLSGPLVLATAVIYRMMLMIFIIFTYIAEVWTWGSKQTCINPSNDFHIS